MPASVGTTFRGWNKGQHAHNPSTWSSWSDPVRLAWCGLVRSSDTVAIRGQRWCSLRRFHHRFRSPLSTFAFHPPAVFLRSFVVPPSIHARHSIAPLPLTSTIFLSLSPLHLPVLWSSSAYITIRALFFGCNHHLSPSITVETTNSHSFCKGTYVRVATLSLFKHNLTFPCHPHYAPLDFTSQPPGSNSTIDPVNNNTSSHDIQRQYTPRPKSSIYRQASGALCTAGRPFTPPPFWF